MKVMNRDQPVVIDGSEAWMVFNHNPPRTAADKKKGPATECRLLGKKATPDSEPPVLAVGRAYQNPKDPYDPLRGRAEAFAIALRNANLPEEVRAGCHEWFRATLRQADDDRMLVCPHCQGISSVRSAHLRRQRHPLPLGGLPRATVVSKRSGKLQRTAAPKPAAPKPAAPKPASPTAGAPGAAAP